MVSPKAFLIGCIVAVALLIVGCFAALFVWDLVSPGMSFEEHEKWAIEQRKKQTVETVGTITDYKVTRLHEYNQHYVTYEFEVDGKKYTDTTAVFDAHPVKYPIGGQGKVCYEPADLKNAVFASKEDNHVCGE